LGLGTKNFDIIEVNEPDISMNLVLTAQPAPLAINIDGVIQVGKTRVTLDTVVSVFNQGMTAEEIVYRYPSLKLADVYATISFYLNHQQEVEEYLQQRQSQAHEIRKTNETRFDTQGLRNRLLARQTEQSI
jgi:uncharacterized protein (DUF433 family)